MEEERQTAEIETKTDGHSRDIGRRTSQRQREGEMADTHKQTNRRKTKEQ